MDVALDRPGPGVFQGHVTYSPLRGSRPQGSSVNLLRDPERSGEGRAELTIVAARRLGP